MTDDLLPARSFDIEASPECVWGSSDFRLPFEPKGDRLAFRDALRKAVSTLARKPVLHAEYASNDAGVCDVENVALYNVGAAAFSGLGSAALVVERSFRQDGPRPHSLRYRSLGSIAADSRWLARRSLASWEGALISETISAAGVWMALHDGLADVRAIWDGRSPLALRIALRASRPLNLVTAIKALVDGAVATAHVYEGSELEELATRLGAQLRRGPEAMAQRLTRDESAVLGRRRLVHCRAGGVQWNPADDRLALILLQNEESDAPSVGIRAELLEVTAAN